MSETFEDRLMRQANHVRDARQKIGRLRESAGLASNRMLGIKSGTYEYDWQEQQLMSAALTNRADEIEAELNEWLRGEGR